MARKTAALHRHDRLETRIPADATFEPFLKRCTAKEGRAPGWRVTAQLMPDARLVFSSMLDEDREVTDWQNAVGAAWILQVVRFAQSSRQQDVPFYQRVEGRKGMHTRELTGRFAALTKTIVVKRMQMQLTKLHLS
ncbi:hypothetical protein DVH05_006332 [Phytophthora capsici]|nr:hypothetical protein DVH05_006332 [Phytophthora capsici]